MAQRDAQPASDEALHAQRDGVIYIGIDPGQSGGLAAISDDRELAPDLLKMPESERELLDWLQQTLPDSVANCVAVLEKVRSSPQMGRASAFTFGCGYGMLRCALVASRIRFTEVAPLKWQRALGVASVGIGKRAIGDVDITAKKNAHKRHAQDLFPDVKMTHAFADALLLAEYCRRLETRT